MPHRRRPAALLLGLVALGLLLAGGLLPLAGAPAIAPAIAQNHETPAPVATPAPEVTPDPAGPVVPAPAEPPRSPDPCPLDTPLPTYPPDGLHPGQPLPHPLCPAVPDANPANLLAFAFNPIFQTLFLGMVLFYSLTGDIGIAIILLTIAIKTLLIPLFRRQIVSQRRMQLLQPEIRAVQQKFKGNRQKIGEETMRLYRERGVNPAAGCLPALLQLFLLIPIYSVISQGLASPDISSALQFLGQPIHGLIECQQPGTLEPCINSTIAWLGDLDAHVPEILFVIPGIDFGISGLALTAALLQLVQMRMMTPNINDPQIRSQQRIFLFLPLISIVYGAFLPAGLFLYWIVFTLYSIVQQYLIVGWGALFPLFGWMPRFARDHQPRFSISTEPIPQRAEGGASRPTPEQRRSTTDSAAGTIRPARQRGRTSRRGRRR
ncbi:MAG TPA: membrane protein insertase YidC [Candidatus Limnocylindria bacterium]|nr:membrane protein insertase YidC [Candidatus Limnocylindria bacterium]